MADLQVDYIQVAQVMLADMPPYNVPLIAEKLTLVRVYVDVSGATSVPNVSARLYVRDAQGQVHVVNQTYNGMPITAKTNPDPHNLNDTVNFLPQVAWLKDDVTFWAEVDPENLVAETDETNNSGGYVTEPFQAGQKLRIAWVAMPYAPPDPPPMLVYPDETVAATGIRFLQRIYPVGVNDVEYFQQPTQMLVPMTKGFSQIAAGENYLPALETFWELVSRRHAWNGSKEPDRLFGWVPEEAEEGGYQGFAWSVWNGGTGRVAAGLATTELGDVTLAHELGHLLNSEGLRHAPGCGAKDTDPDYPNPDGTIDVWGVDLWKRGVLRSPDESYDFMSYCPIKWFKPIRPSKWISRYHYKKLLQGFQPMPPQQQSVGLLSAPQRQLLVSGLVHSPALTVTFGTFYPLTSMVPPDASRGTAYCLELRSATETVLDSRCFDLSFTSLETGEPMDAAAFTLALPYPDGTHSVVLSHLGAELGRVTASNNTPTVHLTSPNGGEYWGATGTYNVTWTASDPDGDTLHFIVSYSPDGGTTWMPLALDVTNSYLAVDSPNLPGSTNALFKVEATDQMHAAEDVSDATFTVGRKGPQVYILSPEGDVTIPPDTPLFLQGYAYDLEDGTLGEAALRWSSSQDGELGTGSQVLVILSEGQHVITLGATDSDGNVGTASISVTVGFRGRVYLPLLLKNYPPPPPTGRDLVGHIGGAFYDVKVAGHRAYVAAGAGLYILDVSTPGQPRLLSKLILPDGAEGIDVVWPYVYVADGWEGGLRIINVSNPASPQEVGFYDTPRYARDVYVTGGYAYVADYDDGLRIIDVSDPMHPIEVGFHDMWGWANGVQVVGSYAYVVCERHGTDKGYGLGVIDVSNPASPQEVGFSDAPVHAQDVYVAGNYAYVADSWRPSLWIIDISNPASPHVTGFRDTAGTHGIYVVGGYAYVADGFYGLRIIDVSNPASLREVGSIDTPGYTEEITVVGDYAYVADEAGGLRIMSVIDPTSPREVGFYDEPGLARGIYVTEGYAYAVDTSDSLAIINVLNPSRPFGVGAYKGPWNVREIPVRSRRVFVAGGYAYATSYWGLLITDVTNPASPSQVGSDSRTAYDVYIAGSYAYVISGTSLRILNVSNPAAPREVGVYETSGLARGIYVVGGYAYVADGYSGLRIVDVTNKNSPRGVGFIDTPGFAASVFVADGHAYVADCPWGLRVIDVAYPTNPWEVGSYDTPGCANDVYVVGSYAYVSDGSSGLEVIDVTNPASPRGIGGYETLDTALDVHVYEGYVYVATGNAGLFILR